MPHLITQSCCSDGSCVYACPVNCIHPTPDEPGFGTAEMLHIDPVACVDCGACVSACPVDAISTEATLTAAQLPFVEINASFYPPRPPGEKLPPTSKLAPVIPAPVVRHGARRLTVAVVGSGPAAMYAADELLTQPGVRVNVFEKLPTPYGLVRNGVAPDHQSTKQVTRLFDAMSHQRDFRFYLNVEVGKDLSHSELLEHHHAVLYAVGALNDRRLTVDGIGLPGVNTATEVVAWYNGHPDFVALPVDLSHERVVVIGNGNVALDVARILTADPDSLAHTDIADHALAALRTSNVREVVIAARRGPAHSAFTLPELIGLTAKADVVLSAADHQLVQRDLAAAKDALTGKKLEILSKLGTDEGAPGMARIRLAYLLTPARVTGTDRVDGVEFTCSDTGNAYRIDAGLVLTSIGYRGKAIRDLPFDEAAGVVPNERGKVTGAQSTYVAGWIKRGPTGFIGTNKSCALQTVQELVADYNDGVLVDPTTRTGALDRLVTARQPAVVSAAGWRAIDSAEVARGDDQGRPRVKFTAVSDMLAAAADAHKPTIRERVLARLFS